MQICTRPGTNTVETAKNKGKVSDDAGTQRPLHIPSWQHGPPHLSHTKQSMGKMKNECLLCGRALC